MWMARNKATGIITGPHSQQFKDQMEANRSTWKRHIWFPAKEPKQAGAPASLADVVKPAKIKAEVISD